MGFAFRVSPAEGVFGRQYGSKVTKCLRKRFGYEVPDEARDADHCSDDLGWSYWGQFQERAKALLASATLPSVLGVDAWHSACLPLNIEHCVIRLPAHGFFDIRGGEYLQCVSLDRFADELRLAGEALNLPTEPEAIDALIQRYHAEDELLDDEPEAAAYVAAAKAASLAQQWKLPLWLIK